VSRTIADGDLIKAVMNPDSVSKILDHESSDEDIVTEKISWAKPAGAYTTFLKSAGIRPCYSTQEVAQLHILYFTFLREQKECTKQADICQVFKKTLKSHTDLQSYTEGRQWSVIIRGENSSIRW
jgi:hypothetical protein